MSAFIDRGIRNTLAWFGRNQADMSISLRRISTGQRVSRAGDDPAGKAVAVNLQTLDIATRRAMKNLNDGVSLIQVADASAGEISDILQRMRELAVQSSSGTLADDDRSALETEFSELISEVDRIADTTRFNGLPLTEGSVAAVVVHAGAGSDGNHRITIQLGDLRAGALGVDTATIGTSPGAYDALDSVDGALDIVNGIRSLLGASHNRLTTALQSAETYVQALGMARSVIEDADLAHESSKLAMQRLRQAGGMSALTGGLRSLENSRSLLLAAAGGGAAAVGGVDAGAALGAGVPAYEKGDFPEDLIPP